MKKIIFLINGLSGGGAERVLVALANRYSLSSEVHIYTLDAVEQRYTTHSSIKVRQLWASRRFSWLGRILLLPFLGLEFSLIVKRERPSHCVSFLTRANLVNCLRFFPRQAINLSERNAIDIQYARGKLSNNFIRFAATKLYPRAKNIIAISSGVKVSLLRLRLSPEKIRVIHNPLTLKADDIKVDPVERTDCVFHVVTAGRLVEQKDHITLIYAISELIQRGIKVDLTIYGEGPLHKTLNNLIEALNLSRFVCIAGFSNNLQEEFRKFDLFALTSIHEGFGNVILEAMHAALPVISSDCPYGPREIIAPECEVPLVQNYDQLNGVFDFGILFPIHDSEALASWIELVSQDESLQHDLKLRSTKRAKMFELDPIAEDYLKNIEV